MIKYLLCLSTTSEPNDSFNTQHPSWNQTIVLIRDYFILHFLHSHTLCNDQIHPLHPRYWVWLFSIKLLYPKMFWICSSLNPKDCSLSNAAVASITVTQCHHACFGWEEHWGLNQYRMGFIETCKHLFSLLFHSTWIRLNSYIISCPRKSIDWLKPVKSNF